jgi:hypothetical protein
VSKTTCWSVSDVTYVHAVDFFVLFILRWIEESAITTEDKAVREEAE